MQFDVLNKYGGRGGPVLSPARLTPSAELGSLSRHSLKSSALGVENSACPFFPHLLSAMIDWRS